MQAREGQAIRPHHSYLATVFNEVDATISRLARKQFFVDPVVDTIWIFILDRL
jgi:hypothetical protein